MLLLIDILLYSKAYITERNQIEACNMVKESHLVGYGVQTQRTIWDSKVKFRNCLSVQIQHTNCSFKVSMLTVFKGASSIKIILVLKELTRPTCCRQFRVPFKRLFGWNSQTGFLSEDISNSFLFSWKLTAGIHTS